MRVIGIYPGRFQPAHQGHFGVYKRLKQISGADTYIATSDKTPTPDSPLTFDEKQQIWVRHGVPANNIVRVKNTYNPEEILSKYTPETTAAVFALGGKDIQRFGSRKGKDPKTGKEMWLKADGKTPGYFQPYVGNENSMKPFSEHGYVFIIPDIRVNGKKISGTKIREALGSTRYTSDQKKKFFQWAFGWYDPSLYQMMVDRFSDSTVTQQTPKPTTTATTTTIKEMVSEILDEYITPQGSEPSTPSKDSVTTQKQEKPLSASEKSKIKKMAIDKEREDKLKADSGKKIAQNWSSFQKKADRDAINKASAALGNPTATTSDFQS